MLFVSRFLSLWAVFYPSMYFGLLISKDILIVKKKYIKKLKTHEYHNLIKNKNNCYVNNSLVAKCCYN